LVSAGSDRVMKIWPLDKVGKRDPSTTVISMVAYCKKWQVYDTWEKIFKKLKIEKEAASTLAGDYKKAIDVLSSAGYPTTLFNEKLNENLVNEIYPIASIFTTEKGDWIIWNEDGYFTGSRKAAKYVGYHINKGKDKESDYYPFEQFDLKYNRPDIIMKDLGLASVELIKAYEYAYFKRLKKMGVAPEQISGEIHIPELKIENFQLNENTNSVTVNVSAFDEKFKLDRLNIFVDDVPVYGSKGFDIKKNLSGSFVGSFTLDVIPGKNKIQISALNEKGAESLKKTFSVVSHSTTKPELYIVSLGVSKYNNADFNLQYAAKDADDVVHFFEKSNLYSAVHVRELTNEKVTKENVLKLKSDFLAQAKVTDVVLFFIAGHGVLNKNLDYYYAASNMDFLNPENGGITFEELEGMLDGIRPYKKLLFMDSCHSGELDKDDYLASTTTNVKKEEGTVAFRNAGNVGAVAKNGIGLGQSAQLLQELFTDLRRGSGATIVSSAGGAEFAMESKDWKNGLFTYCFLSGIKTMQADADGDGRVMLSEIENYVQIKVNEMSGGKQIPTTRRENLEFDYRIW
jgi:hypothetical protein